MAFYMVTAVAFVIGVLVCVHAVRSVHPYWTPYEPDLSRSSEKQEEGGEEEDKLVKFKLFTRQNRYDPEEATVAVLPTHFTHLDPSRQTTLIVHGWQSSLRTPLEVKDAFLTATDSNIFVVDWKDLDSIYYPTAVRHIKLAASQVGTFLNFLRRYAGIATESVHLVGHSLGAHIAGLSAQFVSDESLVGRITGLDPAGPLIQDDRDHRLDKTHAIFVDVIHTCGNILGYSHELGHVDFFPNGGNRSQPGCHILDLTSGTCSHDRAYYLFRESVLKGYTLMGLPPALQHPDLSPLCDAVDRAAPRVPMGLTTPSGARGQYCLPTRASEPFGYDWDWDWDTALAPNPNAAGRRLSATKAAHIRNAFMGRPAYRAGREEEEEN